MTNQNIAPAIHERKGHTPGELKACPNPWCEADEREGDFSPVAHRVPHGNWCVSCTSCNMAGPTRQTESEAETAWNTRTVDSELLEALKRVADAYGFDPSIDSSIWQEVFAAISKAEG